MTFLIHIGWFVRFLFPCLTLLLLLRVHPSTALVLWPPWRGWEQLRHIGPWGLLRYPSTTTQWFPGSRPFVLYLDDDDDDSSNASDGSTAKTTTKLVPLSSLPTYNTTTHRRIVALSDTHGNHRFYTAAIPPCDVLLHCGDILQRYGYLGKLGGGRTVLADFAAWLRTDVPQASYKVVVGGNHDALLQSMGKEAVQTFLRHYAGDSVVYLEHEMAHVADLVVFGSPWSPMGKTSNTAFQSGQNAQPLVDQALQNSDNSKSDREVLAQQQQVDILMTHATCLAWEPLIQAKQVQLWVHGH